MNISGIALTDVGQKRKVNEDAYGYFPECGLFVVADGMGGHVAGSTASRIAVNKMQEFFSGSFDMDKVSLDSAADETLDPPALKLKQAVEYANHAIYAATMQDSSLTGMGSTVVCLWLHEQAAYIAHVGDSRLYRIRDEQISLLTHDHSLVYELFKQGEITFEEMRYHPKRNIITRALCTEEVQVELQQEQWQAGDYFLLCSDGLSNLILEEELLATILSEKDLETAAHSLIAQANQRGGSDNITLIAVRIEGILKN